MQVFKCILYNDKKFLNLHNGAGFKGDLINVCICKNDGLVFLNPRWSSEAYDTYYKNEYDKKYFNMEEFEELKSIESANNIIACLNEENLTQFNNILEIGPGMGIDLEYLSKFYKNSNFYALEKNIKCIKRLKSLGFQCYDEGMLDNDNYNEKFDLIILNHVLEHITNPLEFLLKIKSKLSAKGVLYIAVPNMMKPFGNLRRYWFRVPHIWYFSTSTLSRITKLVKLRSLTIKDGYELIGIFKKGESIIEIDNIYKKQLFLIRRILFFQDSKYIFQKIMQRIISIFPNNFKNFIPIKIKDTLYSVLYRR